MNSKGSKSAWPGFLEGGRGGTSWGQGDIEGVATGEVDAPNCHKAQMHIGSEAGCSLHSEEGSMKVRNMYHREGQSKASAPQTSNSTI